MRPAFTLRTNSVYFPNVGYQRLNVTNTTWFGPPGTTIATSSFGVITPTEVNDPRYAQVAVRLMF